MKTVKKVVKKKAAKKEKTNEEKIDILMRKTRDKMLELGVSEIVTIVKHGDSFNLGCHNASPAMVGMMEKVKRDILEDVSAQKPMDMLAYMPTKMPANIKKIMKSIAKKIEASQNSLGKDKIVAARPLGKVVGKRRKK